MKRLLFAIFLFAAFYGQSQEFEPGTTSTYKVDAFEYPIQISIPSNYDPGKPWPIVYYYHGTNGRPTTRLLSYLTEQKDWLIIGMSYKRRGRFPYSPQNLQDEIDIFYQIHADLSNKLAIDPKKIYTAGFSKGGWMSSYFIQSIPELAGGMVLGGGLIELSDQVQTKLNKSVFLGSGDLDQNAAPTFHATTGFKKLGCDACLDYWPDKGHEGPDLRNPDRIRKIQQWLRIQAGTTRQAVAQKWVESRIKHIEKLQRESGAIPALHELIQLSTMPYSDIVDKEAKAKIKQLQTNFEAEPAVQAEYNAWLRFRKTLAFESQDRRVETLAEALVQYTEISDNYPTTRYGKLAKKSVTRIRQSLGLD